MYLIKVLLTLPVGYPAHLYCQMYSEFAIEKRTPFLWAPTLFTSEKIYKTDPRFQELFKQLPGRFLKSELQPFLSKMGVREDLIISQASNPGFCTAVGINMFSKGDAQILVDSEFPVIDNDAYHWMMKREISHIKYNDGFTKNIIPTVCQTAACIVGARSLSFLRTMGLVIAVGAISGFPFSKWRHDKTHREWLKNIFF